MSSLHLVNWDATAGKFRSHSPWGSLEETQHALQTYQPHPLLQQLIDELSVMWRNSGATGICQSCFAGTRRGNTFRKGRGCCGDCSNLGAEKCEGKPLACATYGCEELQRRFVSECELAVEIRTITSDVLRTATGTYHLGIGVYSQAWKDSISIATWVDIEACRDEFESLILKVRRFVYGDLDDWWYHE